MACLGHPASPTSQQRVKCGYTGVNSSLHVGARSLLWTGATGKEKPAIFLTISPGVKGGPHSVLRFWGSHNKVTCFIYIAVIGMSIPNLLRASRHTRHAVGESERRIELGSNHHLTSRIDVSPFAIDK